MRGQVHRQQHSGPGSASPTRLLSLESCFGGLGCRDGGSGKEAQAVELPFLDGADSILEISRSRPTPGQVGLGGADTEGLCRHLGVVPEVTGGTGESGN